MTKLMVNDINVKGKRVLVRVDFNVPVENGRVIDDRRLREAIPTILYLIKNGAKIVLISHLGRPKGKKNKKFSLKPCVIVLSELLAKKVIFLDTCIGCKVKNTVDNLKNGQVVLLENLRFHAQEVQNGESFSRKLAELADLYVNDAFGTIHRAHASTEGVTHFIDLCTMGFLVSRELLYIQTALEAPKRSFVAVLGGSKVADKLGAIDNLLPKVDYLILGGGMLCTFLKAKGMESGSSLFERDKIPLAKKILNNFEKKLLLPVDCMVTDFFDFDSRTIGNTKCVKIDSIEPGWSVIDVGIITILKFTNVLRSARTIIWNGPLGVSEITRASTATFSVAKAIAEATKNGAITIVGGGDSALAIRKAGMGDKISHISTGGGASLELMEGKVLPGVASLTDRF